MRAENDHGVTLPDFASKPKRGASRRRVLVVDDNMEAVQMMALALKDMGHEVQFAINGFAAIEMARTFHPHVVLLDVRLPEFSGDDVVRRLKWSPGVEGVRIVAITSEGGAAMRRRARHAGCEALHVRPLDPAVLQSVVGE
jgi:CheY-like chemotaxis protein